jgi:LacI family transcriptional regulator
VKVTRYLIDLGHKRFAIISSRTKNNDRAAARLRGYLAALDEAGLPIESNAIVESGHTIAEARLAMSRLLLLSRKPTAVICGNDTLAYGALQECIWSGLRVPDDISITGFDDIEIAAHCVPALTTLRVPAHEIGQQAALVVLAAQRNEERAKSVRFDLELIVRGTTQRCRSQDPPSPPALEEGKTT